MAAEKIDPSTVRFYDKAGKEIKPKSMSLAPLAALGPPGVAAAGAGAIASEVGNILTGDIVVVHYSTGPRGTKKKPLPPVDYEVHINLAALGIGAITVAGAMWLLGLGIGTNPITDRPAVVKRQRWQGIFLGGGPTTGDDVPITGPHPRPRPTPPPTPGDSPIVGAVRFIPLGGPILAELLKGLGL